MEDKSLELITKLYIEMKEQFAAVNGRMDTMQEAVNGRIDALQNEVKFMGNQITKIENDLKPKVEAALDGYKQHTDMLERIEKEVSRQDEIIMRRIK